MGIQRTKLQDFANPDVQQEIMLDEQTTAQRILETAHYDTNLFALEGALPDGSVQRFTLGDAVFPSIQRGATLKVVPQTMNVA